MESEKQIDGRALTSRNRCAEKPKKFIVRKIPITDRTGISRPSNDVHRPFKRSKLKQAIYAVDPGMHGLIGF